MLHDEPKVIQIAYREQHIDFRSILQGAGVQLHDLRIVRADGAADVGQHALPALGPDQQGGVVVLLQGGRPGDLNPAGRTGGQKIRAFGPVNGQTGCLLYTSDAADDL